jgi:hypothetical protein
VFGHADASDGAAGACDLECRVDRLFEADALKHGVRAETVCQFANALDGLLATLANDIGGSELLPERDPLGVVAKQDDPLGAEPLRGDHAAEVDGAVADDGDRLRRARPWPRRRRGARCPSRQ